MVWGAFILVMDVEKGKKKGISKTFNGIF